MISNDPVHLKKRKSVVTDSPCQKKQKKTTRKTQQLTPFFDNVSVNEKTMIDEKLAELIYGCNLSLDLVQSKYFKNYTNSLRPAYQLPSVQDLSNNMLLDLHCQVTGNQPNPSGCEGVMMMQKIKKQNKCHQVIAFLRVNARNARHEYFRRYI